jgi:VIT1/CCC1 family predicted Fe2+/Mn2+ transporter
MVQDLALFARNSFLPWVIRLATLGVGAGLLSFYLGEGHSLSLKDQGGKN